MADTNNHRIRAIDLKTLQASTLEIAGLKPPATAGSRNATAGRQASRGCRLAVVRAEHGELRLARGTGVSGRAIRSTPWRRWSIALRMPSRRASAVQRERSFARGSASLSGSRSRQPTFEIRLPVKGQSGRDVVRVAVDYYYCREGSEGLCKIGSGWPGSCPSSSRLRRKRRLFICGTGQSDR